MGDGRGYLLPRTVFLDGDFPALLADGRLPPLVAFCAFLVLLADFADCFEPGFVTLVDVFGRGTSGAKLTDPLASSAALGMAWATPGRLPVSAIAAAMANCSKR